MAKHITILLLALLLSGSCVVAQASGDGGERTKTLLADLKKDPGPTVDRFKERELADLLKQRQYQAVEQLATAGTLALPADTWRVEVLQSFRVKALLAEHKNEEALAAAKGLFNVCGTGYVKDALPLLFEALSAARPQDPTLVPRLKLQILAGARESESEREVEFAKVNGNTVMESIKADPAPYEAALAVRTSLTRWRDRYGTGNLLLLSGEVKRAKEVFDWIYANYPEGELRYASEAKAKMIKAEDGAMGRANEFVRLIRAGQ